MRSSRLLFACLHLASGLATSLCDEIGDWKITWRDEFDSENLDRNVWTIPTGANSSFGRQATVTEDDTYVRDGMLVLRSREIAQGHWTTGAAITNPRKYNSTAVGKEWRYGRFCIRAKLPGAGLGKSQGLWPAHWMMPSDYSEHCGYNEIDIMEMVNGDGNAWGTYWYWGPGGGGPPGMPNCTGQPFRCNDTLGHTTGSVQVQSYYSEFHEYAVEWTPVSLTYLIDRKPYRIFNESASLPVNSHYLMLNSAVGGTWPGPPNTKTEFPAFHYIDYVRVTQKEHY